MGIVNRTKDTSEQKESLTAVALAVANGTDIPVAMIERAQVITDCKVTCLGISGAPTVLLKALRFVAGTGGSSFAIGSTFTYLAFGTSGIASYSLPATGSSLLQLQKGDMIVAVQGGGTGAATTATIIDLVVQNVQDIKTWY